MTGQTSFSYVDELKEVESLISDVVLVARSSSDMTVRALQKGIASGALHEWVERVELEGADGTPGYAADRARLISQINTAMLDL